MRTTLLQLWTAFLADDDMRWLEKIVGNIPPNDLDRLQAFIATLDGITSQEQMYRHR